MFMSDSIGTPISNVNRYSDSLRPDNIGMSIGSRIKEARRAKKLTQKELASKVGMTQGSLSELETGESKGTTMIASFAAALGVNALWLETGKGTMQGEPGPVVDEHGFIQDGPGVYEGAMRVVVGEEDDVIHVRKVTLRLRAGVTGFEADPVLEDGGVLPMPRHVIEALNLRTSGLIAMQIDGPSMQPMLFEDDWVVIDTSDRKLVNGECYAVNWDAEPIVKQLVYEGGQWYINSINPNFKRQNVKSKPCAIVGRLIYQPGRVLAGRL